MCTAFAHEGHEKLLGGGLAAVDVDRLGEPCDDRDENRQRDRMQLAIGGVKELIANRRPKVGGKRKQKFNRVGRDDHVERLEDVQLTRKYMSKRRQKASKTYLDTGIGSTKLVNEQRHCPRRKFGRTNKNVPVQCKLIKQ